MSKHPNTPRDTNQLAHFVVSIATGEVAYTPEPPSTKDPIAAEFGRRGGLKGGAARADKLSPERKREIARAAAAARWAKKP